MIVYYWIWYNSEIIVSRVELNLSVAYIHRLHPNNYYLLGHKDLLPELLRDIMPTESFFAYESIWCVHFRKCKEANI